MDKMLRSMSSRMFSEWAVFFGLEPFGEERADLRMAIIASVMANKPVYGYRQGRRTSPRDFMPDFSGTRRKSAWIRDMQALKSYSTFHNAKIELERRNA